MGTSNSLPGQWVQVESAQVLKVWQIDGATTYPQIAMLRVNPALYQSFQANPTALFDFVNRNHLFPDPIRAAGPVVALGSVGTETPIGYLIILSHSRTSAAMVSVLPMLQEGNF